MSSSQSSNNIASVAFAAFNRFFHHTSSETIAKMTSQSSQTSPATAPNPSASPISPTYSDAGSGFSAPSPSPFSSSSASTSATSYNGSGVPDFSDYHHSGSLYDYSTSPSGPSEVDASLARLYNPTTGEILAGQPGGVSSEYSAFSSVHHSSGDPVYTPAGELDLSYNSVLEAGYSSPTQNECSSYITWSPRNQAQSLADSHSNNSYQRLQQQGQHIVDTTSTSTINHSNGGGSGDGSSSTSIPPSTSSSQSSAVNFNVSNAPAKPSMLGPLYIPPPQPSSMPLSASSTGGSVPIHSPIPSRYPDPSAVSGGQPAQYPQSQSLMPPQSEYPHRHHQRHSSSGSTGSNGGHPVLFDVDLDEWHPHPVAQSHSQPHPQSQHGRYPSSGSVSVSPPQMYQQIALQQSQQSYGHPQIPRPHPTSSPPRPASHSHAQSLHLNLSVNPHPAGSPASPLSSLSPGQMSLPLTLGYEVGHGLGADYGMVVGNGNGLGLTSGPPHTPMSSLNVASPVVGPSSYPGMTSSGRAGNSQVFLNQKRASLGLAQPSASLNPGSLSPTSRHHPHPYAQGYQQRSAHGRPSPLQPHHQMQQARRSPLHQEYFDDANPGARKVNSMNPAGIPEDDDYARQYEKMYKQDMRRNERSRDKAQLPGTSGVKQTLDQRRHSAPLLDMQHLSRSQLGEYRMQPSPMPILLGEIGRRPSAPAVHQGHHFAQQQKYGSPNNGGYAPASSTSPSSVSSSSRSVPLPPSLSASSSNSSIASRSPVAHLASQSLPAQHSQQQSGLAAVATQHDRTRLLSDIMNSSSMACIPGSMFDEHGINVVSEGVNVPSMMQLEIEEKISPHQQQHQHQQASFDMDMGMELMDVDTHHGVRVDMDLGMDAVTRMNMEFSGLRHHHPSSSDHTATGTSVYNPPMPVTIDMSDLTDGHVNSNQAVSPSMMMLEDHGNPNNIKTGDFEQRQDMFDFDSVLDAAPSPTLVGGATGVGMVQDWQKAGGEYDSADSSDSDSEGEGGLMLLSGVETGSRDGLEGGRGGRGEVEAGAVKSSGKQRRAKAGSTALSGDILTTGSATVKRAGTVGKSTMKQRASTRTITSRSTRTKTSTQTLTPQNVKPDTNGGEVDSGVGEDEDADGEEDLEEDPGEVEVAEEDEDDLSSSDESFDDDDDKDGEFVPRSRSKGATVSRSNSRRALPGFAPLGLSASAPVASRARAGGRSLRSRGNSNGRYNPYSVYAATTSAAQQPAEAGSSAPSISGLRTLNATATGFESGASDRSLSPSISGDDGSVDGKAHKAKPAASLPVPVPVPNLTKKSRGRRVPTVSSLEELRKTGSSQANGSSASSGTTRKGRGGGGSKGTRMYLCDVEGCGKCFARGEHLKRHVRSIHTNEKPHTCPYPGCGKDFSRHDNLGQHMRVHKDYVPPPGSVKA